MSTRSSAATSPTGAARPRPRPRHPRWPSRTPTDMDDKVNYTLVGAFVLVLGAVLVAAVLWLAAGLGGREPVDRYQAFIEESVAGLNLDAPVKLQDRKSTRLNSSHSQ